MKSLISKYLNEIPENRKDSLNQLRNTLLTNLPKGFEESFHYGMIGYVVPHSIYPNGYHCTPEIPLPFISIANQKNFIALYHMGIYADPSILNWFTEEDPKHCKRKLDMGKSCIRFKKSNEIPFDLIKELLNKMSCEEWIRIYESNIKSK